ncbi:helix-turn-helix domain-containing protein [Nocardia tengchongensis]
MDQQRSLAKAFGCARVVFDDGLAAREAARCGGCRSLRTVSCRKR